MTIGQLHDIFLQCPGGVATDSRSLRGGELFFALKGETFDGNAFALKALEAGASYCVVTEGSDASRFADARIIAFPDTLKALQDLAAYHREHTLCEQGRIPLLALTGTNGKTTTKELLRCVLSTKYNIVATEGNFNNNIGVPLTLLRLQPDTQMAVVEMGASHPGDIRELVDIAHPDYGLITNVGRAHLLGFGSFEGVKRTKGEMYDYISHSGQAAFVNADSAFLVEMAAQRNGLKTVEYGMSRQDAAVLPTDALHPFLRLQICSKVLNTNLIGAYNSANVLAAMAVGSYFGVPQDDAIAAIEAYVPGNNRSQMLNTPHNTLIVDAYNANPSSMAVALDSFSSMHFPRKAVCLGDMLELGAESLAEHVKVLEKVRDISPDLVVLVGEEFAAANLTAGKCDYHCFPSGKEAAEFLSGSSLNGYAVLLKGSHGTHMEQLMDSLK